MSAEFSAKIAMLRKEKDLTQRQAAEDLGISQALLSHYEKGIRECSLPFVTRCAAYYGVSCDYLLGVSEEKNAAGKITLYPDADDPDPDLAAAAVLAQAILDLVKELSRRDGAEARQLIDCLSLSLRRYLLLLAGDRERYLLTGLSLEECFDAARKRKKDPSVVLASAAVERLMEATDERVRDALRRIL